MTINNVQLAKAIGALYHLTNGGEGDWTDTDEAIQKAAFLLWEKATCSSEEMAVMLNVYSPLDRGAIADFVDISIDRVDAAIAQAKAEEDERRYYAMLTEDDIRRALEDDTVW